MSKLEMLTRKKWFLLVTIIVPLFVLFIVGITFAASDKVSKVSGYAGVCLALNSLAAIILSVPMLFLNDLKIAQKKAIAAKLGTNLVKLIRFLLFVISLVFWVFGFFVGIMPLTDGGVTNLETFEIISFGFSLGSILMYVLLYTNYAYFNIVTSAGREYAYKRSWKKTIMRIVITLILGLAVIIAINNIENEFLTIVMSWIIPLVSVIMLIRTIKLYGLNLNVDDEGLSKNSRKWQKVLRENESGNSYKSTVNTQTSSGNEKLPEISDTTLQSKVQSVVSSGLYCASVSRVSGGVINGIVVHVRYDFPVGSISSEQNNIRSSTESEIKNKVMSVFREVQKEYRNCNSLSVSVNHQN